MNIHVKSILSALVFSFLLYNKSLGLNLLLISVLTVVLLSAPRKGNQIPWPYTFTYMATALFVFLNPTGFAIFVHILTFIVYVGKAISPKTSLFISWFVGLINLAGSSIVHLAKSQKQPNVEKGKISESTRNHIKGTLLTIMLLVIFATLYKEANPVFENLVDQVKLDFISVPWLFFTFFGYVLSLHLLRPLYPKKLIEYDQGQKNELEKPSELILIGAKKKLRGEHTMGCMAFSALNLLLALYLATDLIYLLHESEITYTGYSRSVHKGVSALMFSIVCAVLLILFFFRGHLNFFSGNKRLKALTYLWIGLNVMLVAFTWYKNHEYVAALGLTYKRIGVFVYLILTLTGLLTAYIKVARIRNFMYLVRCNTATFFVLLTLGAAIPWDRAITWYNLRYIELPDMEYLIGLGDGNSLQLNDFANENVQKIPIGLQNDITEKYNRFVKVQADKTWQEYSLYHFVYSHPK